VSLFKKPPINLNDQLAKLLFRGLEVADQSLAATQLGNIGYYRLSAYTRPFLELPEREKFKPNTKWEQVIHIYEFDRHLRLLIFDAIERIEVGIRSRLINATCLHHDDAHWYLDSGNFHPKFNHQSFINKLEREVGICYDSKTNERVMPENHSEKFIRHYYDEYSSPYLPPLWMALELLTMGNLSMLFKGLGDATVKSEISAEWNVTAKVFESWLHSVSVLRNFCAHHSRLWNREMSIKPRIPNELIPLRPEVHRLHGQLIVMLKLLDRTSPENHWRKRFVELLSEYEQIDPTAMGFPIEWERESFWQNTNL
jgi:abortive infection bacteriophage resistance protein